MSTKEKKIMKISLSAPDRETLARFVRELQLDIGGGGPRRLPDGTLSMDAYVPEELLGKLKKAHVAFKIVEDATKVGKERQKEVGRGNRFEKGNVVPRGLGRKE